MRPQLTWPTVPIESIRLGEDIMALRECLRWLDFVDPGNVTDDVKEGRKILRVTASQIRMCQRYAEAKMRRDYLDPKRRKIERSAHEAV